MNLWHIFQSFSVGHKNSTHILCVLLRRDTQSSAQRAYARPARAVRLRSVIVEWGQCPKEIPETFFHFVRINGN
jgi:hypothetical protein